MKDSYDILVVGAGPAGSVAAYTAAKAGMSVLLIEKRSAVGIPVKFAEEILKKELEEFIEPEHGFISTEIKHVSINFEKSDGSKHNIIKNDTSDTEGYVLDRKIFDRELVWRAAAAGAEVQTRATAAAPVIEDGKVVGAVIHQNGEAREVRAKIIIAADGVESKFSRAVVNIPTPSLGDLLSFARYFVNNADIDENTVSYCFSQRYAPGGYVKISPKGKRCASVSVCVDVTKSDERLCARDYLDKFMSENFPNSSATELGAGAIFACEPLENLTADNFLIAGDATRLSNPVTGGGIHSAMYSGRLAANVAVEAIKAGDTSKRALSGYETELRLSNMFSKLTKACALKKLIDGFNNERPDLLCAEKFEQLEIF